VLKQQAYGIHVPAAGRGVQSCCTEPIGFPHVNEARIVREQAAQRFDVALRARLKEDGEALNLALFDFGLEGAPTRETVVLRNG
jgi:hypothetical protein